MTGAIPELGAGRIPPHDLDAEMVVLSAVLLESDALERVQTLLRPDMFYSPAHRWIFEACLAVTKLGQPVDGVTVAGWLKTRQKFADTGGVPYLGRVIDQVASVHNLEAHAGIVREKARLRKLISQCQRIAIEAYGDVGNVKSFFDGVAQTMLEVTRDEAAASAAVPMRQVVAQAIAAIDAAREAPDGITGFSTGLTDLDAWTSGLHPEELIVIAGRPGMGKSSIVTDICMGAANRGGPEQIASALFCLEMPIEQVGIRLVVGQSNLNISAARSGRITDEERHVIVETGQLLEQMPIWMLGTAEGLLDIRAKVRGLQLECSRMMTNEATPRPVRLGIVAVDYLQLVKAATGGRERSREQEVSEVARGLKNLAKDLGVCVIALAQLNRAVEDRADKRPTMRDLRESGEIENAADLIAFLYRESYYNKETPATDVAECILAKQRNGPTGTIMLGFNAHSTYFYDLTPERKAALAARPGSS